MNDAERRRFEEWHFSIWGQPSCPASEDAKERARIAWGAGQHEIAAAAGSAADALEQAVTELAPFMDGRMVEFRGPPLSSYAYEKMIDAALAVRKMRPDRATGFACAIGRHQECESADRCECQCHAPTEAAKGSVPDAS